VQPFVRFSLRFAIYGVVTLYLIGDLFVFSGPLRRKIDASRPDSAAALAAARERGICARVFNHTITLDQMDRAVADRLRLEGKPPDSGDRRLLRYAALDELIDHELLRVKVMHNTEFTASAKEIDARLASVAARFDGQAAFEKILPAQGFPTLQAFRDHLAARIQQEKYVEARIAPLVAVSREEADEWLAKHRVAGEPAEIIAAIESVKRRHATADFRAALRQFEAHRILILHDVLND
jgi:hypothetical protein